MSVGLGGSLLVILVFFAILGTIIVSAVLAESTLHAQAPSDAPVEAGSGSTGS